MQDNVNADWTTRLLPYMDAGGGIIFEDPNNVGDLAAGVSILGGSGHSPGPDPTTVTIEHVDGLTTAPNLFTDGGSADSTFTNNHIIFAEPDASDPLQPFLTLTTGTDTWSVGLYGDFGDGRIVLTGLDNGWHGVSDGSTEQQNHYELLYNEICWVLLGGC